MRWCRGQKPAKLPRVHRPRCGRLSPGECAYQLAPDPGVPNVGPGIGGYAPTGWAVWLREVVWDAIPRAGDDLSFGAEVDQARHRFLGTKPSLARPYGAVGGLQRRRRSRCPQSDMH